MIRQAFADFLLSQSTLTNVVGQRIRPLFLAQSDTYPGITFRRITAGHDAPLDDEDNLPGPHFEVTSWARTYSAAVSLAELVRAALENVGRETWTPAASNVVVQAVTYLDEEDVWDEDVEGGDKPIYGVRQIYELIYED